MTQRRCPGPAGLHPDPTQPPLIDAPLCGGCCTRLAQALRDLPEQYAHLWLAMIPSTAQPEPQPGGKVSGSREAPLPLLAGPREFMDRILEVCASWAEAVTVELRLADPTPPGRRERLDGWLLTASCRTLARHLQPWVAMPAQAMVRRVTTVELDRLLYDDEELLGGTMAGGAWVTRDLSGVDGALEVLDLRREARRMLGLIRGKDRLPEPCPNPACEQKALVRWNGADQVECEACGEVWPERDYERLMRVLGEYRESTKGAKA